MADPPPSYPTSFRIGFTPTKKPLVGLAQLKNHLALLRAFTELRKHIDTLIGEETRLLPDAVPEDKERRWTYFVGLATERFEKWCAALKHEHFREEGHLPPLDVIMVWHAYMLNPRWYAEDTHRIPALSGLKNVRVMHERGFICSDDLPALLSSPPTPTRTAHWEQSTGLQFDYVQCAVQLTQRVIVCPGCQVEFRVDLLTKSGTGYLQHAFRATCPRAECQFAITKERLAVHKLAQDLAAGAGLAGVHAHPVSPSDPFTARALAAHLIRRTRAKHGLAPDEAQERLCNLIMADCKHTMLRVRKQCTFGVAGGVTGVHRGLIARILSAYTDDRVVSVDLVGAVLRQGSFVEKMHTLRWTEVGFFDGGKEDGDERALWHAVARYHAFLDLLHSAPESFFVPTLDIDLLWHTHQLMPAQYAEDCLTYVKRFVDHDDKVEEKRLSGAFDVTRRAWKARFGIDYTHCGCPIPGDTIGQKLSRLIKSSSSSPSSPSNSNPAIPAPLERPDARAATHASDHSIVQSAPRSKRAHEVAIRKYEVQMRKSRERNAKMSLKNKDGKKSVLPVDHYPPFLVPVPMYFDYSAEGCVAATRGMVGGTFGSCANGTAAGGCAPCGASAGGSCGSVGGCVNGTGGNGGNCVANGGGCSVGGFG